MKFIKRLEKREKAIQDWLKKNNAEMFLKKADQILNNLPRENIKKAFVEQIQLALEHCAENDEIKALDFEWSYHGGKIGGAYAYGLDSRVAEGDLSRKTDLGPEELPGIEAEFEDGCSVDEDFAEIPVYHAINALVESLNPILDQSEELGNLLEDTECLITDYFQIWNYKVASEACEQLKGNIEVQKLKNRAPFWVTMTVSGRWSVPIMLID